MKLLLSIFTISLVLVSCKPDPVVVDPVDDYDRSALLRNLANNYIVEAYTDLYTRCIALEDKFLVFKTTVNQTNLDELQLAWKEALMVWQSVGMLEFSHGNTNQQRAHFNIFPTDTAMINSNILNGWVIDAASNLPAQGFQAIDYLIHGVGSNDTEVLAKYTSDVLASSRMIYLEQIIESIVSHSGVIMAAWSDSTVDFANNNADNSVGSSMGLLTNAYIQHFEGYVRKGKIGLPAGVFNGFTQTPMPDHVEALYYGQSLDFAIESVSKYKDVFLGIGYSNGTEGAGFDDYLNYVNAELNGQPLADVISNQFDVCLTSLNGLSDPLSNEVVANQTAVINTYNELQKLVGYLKTDMVSALGIQITYADTDGD